MQKEAEAHAEDDKKKQDAVEAKNVAESLIYTAEKAIRDNKEKISADLATEIETKIADLKKVKDSTDLAAIKSATEALSLATQKIGEAMNKQAQPEQGGGNTEPPKDADAQGGTVHDV